MSLDTVLTSDAGLTLVGAVVGSVWTLLKSSAWFTARRERRTAQALQALEAGVEQTYRSYVRAIKEGREDGRLTAAERTRARMMARERAIVLAREQGVDLLRAVGEDYLDVWIAKMVQRLKRG